MNSIYELGIPILGRFSRGSGARPFLYPVQIGLGNRPHTGMYSTGILGNELNLWIGLFLL